MFNYSDASASKHYDRNGGIVISFGYVNKSLQKYQR
jgi:hypothetical protein